MKKLLKIMTLGMLMGSGAALAGTTSWANATPPATTAPDGATSWAGSTPPPAPAPTPDGTTNWAG